MLKCIIVEDQPQASQLIKNHIKKIPFLELTGVLKDAGQAADFTKTNNPDLIFLGINKPVVTGSAVFQILHQERMVILISANRKFAFEAFEHQAIDFLVKPLLFERFFRAAEKAYKHKFRAPENNGNEANMTLKGGFIFIKEGTRHVRIELDDVYYIMGLKNYVSIFTKTQRIVSLMTMREMEDLLPAHRFIRVHRSYFVAMDKIVSVEKQQIHMKEKVIPIGNIYLPLFMKRLNSKVN